MNELTGKNLWAAAGHVFAHAFVEATGGPLPNTNYNS